MGEEPMQMHTVILLVLGILAISWYYVCIIEIGRAPQAPGAPAPHAFRQFQAVSIPTIGVALATFVGMLLGLQSVAPKVDKRAEAVQKTAQAVNESQAVVTASATQPGAADDAAVKAQESVSEAVKQTQELQAFAERAIPSTLQWAAAAAYIGSLVLAVYFWWRAYKAGQTADPVVSNLAQSFLGLLAGALSILLNVPGGP